MQTLCGPAQRKFLGCMVIICPVFAQNAIRPPPPLHSKLERRGLFVNKQLFIPPKFLGIQLQIIHQIVGKTSFNSRNISLSIYRPTEWRFFFLIHSHFKFLSLTCLINSTFPQSLLIQF